MSGHEPTIRTIRYEVNQAWKTDVEQLLADAITRKKDDEATRRLGAYMRANNQNAITVLS